jgi:hypothetical protein
MRYDDTMAMLALSAVPARRTAAVDPKRSFGGVVTGEGRAK